MPTTAKSTGGVATWTALTLALPLMAQAGTGDARECQGMDTPIHRASVRAYEKALEALAEVLRQGTRLATRARNDTL